VCWNGQKTPSLSKTRYFSILEKKCLIL